VTTAPDLIFFGGPVWTGDAALPSCSAVAVTRGRITAGGGESVREQAGVLEALQAGRDERDLRYQVAHLQVVRPSDIQRIGQLGVRALADVAVLDRKPFDLASEKVWQTNVVSIFAEGQRVHQAPEL